MASTGDTIYGFFKDFRPNTDGEKGLIRFFLKSCHETVEDFPLGLEFRVFPIESFQGLRSLGFEINVGSGVLEYVPRVFLEVWWF